MSVSSIVNSSGIESRFPFSFLPRSNCVGRFFADRRLAVMKTGIAIVAVGAVVSLSVQATITAIAFVALGVILLFAVYYVKNFESSLQIRNNIAILHNENLHLKVSNKNMEQVTRTLQIEEGRIQAVNRSMTQHIQQVQQQVAALSAENQNLTQNNLSLIGSSKEMHQANGQLQLRLDALRNVIPQLEAQADRFSQDNQSLARQVDTFQHGLNAFSTENTQREQSLSNFKMSQDQNLRAMAQNIQHSQNLAQGLLHTVHAQKNELTHQLSTFHNTTLHAQSIEKDLKARTAELGSLEKRIENRTLALIELEGQLQSTQRAFSQETAKLVNLRQDLSLVQTLLSKERVGLEDVEKRLEESSRTFRGIEAGLSKSIEDTIVKKKLIEQALDIKIKEKGQQLKEVMAKLVHASR